MYQQQTMDSKLSLFSLKSQTFGLRQTNWLINFWTFGFLGQTTIISTKKLSFYIHIPNIHLGLRFEFGPQRIRDLAFVCL